MKRLLHSRGEERGQQDMYSAYYNQFTPSSEWMFEFNEGTQTITDYIGTDTDIVIPPMLNGKEVLRIKGRTNSDKGVFEEKGLTSVVLPPTLIAIGDDQGGSSSEFGGNALTELIIPDSVTTIGSWAYENNQLTKLCIPHSVVSLGAGAFSRNHLTELMLPESLTFISKFAFWHNRLEELYLPTTVQTIAQSAFRHNRLKEVRLPDSVTTVEEKAFQTNKLTEAVLSDSLTVIGESAFWGNDLTEVNIPDSVIKIGDKAFRMNPLQDATIPTHSQFSTDGLDAAFPPKAVIQKYKTNKE